MADSPKAEVVRLTVTEVARRLQLRYHRARDLMLSGKLGTTAMQGRHLTVLETNLATYLIKQKAVVKR